MKLNCWKEILATQYINLITDMAIMTLFMKQLQLTITLHAFYIIPGMCSAAKYETFLCYDMI